MVKEKMGDELGTMCVCSILSAGSTLLMEIGQLYPGTVLQVSSSATSVLVRFPAACPGGQIRKRLDSLVRDGLLESWHWSWK